VIGPLTASNPPFAAALQGAVILYLLYLALMLWRRGATEMSSGGVITFRRVFVTTLLNPKAIIFAFTLLPQRGDSSELAPCLLILSLQIVAIGFGWIFLGGMFHGRSRDSRSGNIGYRLSALVLVALAGMMGGHLLSLA
jgi:threonine/homoserine/homoserine lactone efflux protein